MQKKLFALLILFCVSVVMHAQRPKEALLEKLKTSKEDTSKVKLLLELGDLYSNSEPATATAYFRQALTLSEKLDYKFGIYRSYVLYGGVFLFTAAFDSSLYYNFKAYDAAKETNDPISPGIALFNIGITYRDKSDFENAIEYSLKGLSVIEKYNKPEIEVQVNDALQILYQSRGEYEKAMFYGRRAIAQSRQLNNKLQLVKSLTNLSMSYQDMEKLDSGYNMLKEAERLSIAFNEPWITAGINANLAGYAVKRRSYAEARNYAFRNLETYKQIGDPSGVAGAFRVLGLCDLQQGKLASARQYLDSGLVITQQNQLAAEEVNLLRAISMVEYARQSYEAGYDYDSKAGKTLDKLVRDIMSQQSAELEKKYETEKQQSAIRTLEAEKKVQQLSIKQKNIGIYILIGCAIVLVLLSVLIFRTQKQKQKLQQQRISELETEKQLSATEAVLKGEEQERSRLAKDLHDGLGGILSGIKYSFNTMKGNLHLSPENQHAFEKGVEMLDVSIKEMRRVAHNMMPEALLKFGLDAALRDFCNDINQSGALKVSYQSIGMADNEINQSAAIPVYRIIQELVNNIIKHANASTAIVQLSNDNNLISITVEDDGKGFDIASSDQTQGIGWSNIRSRIDYLKGQVNIQSAAGEGTSVHIGFPAMA
jgi:two-component system, NarL family, sensor kinase